jgi:hypothetical protein
MTTYKIVRTFQRKGIPPQVIDEGLTLEEAQAHCKDPNTSSSTAFTRDTMAIALKLGPWFDGYEEE